MANEKREKEYNKVDDEVTALDPNLSTYYDHYNDFGDEAVVKPGISDNGDKGWFYGFEWYREFNDGSGDGKWIFDIKLFFENFDDAIIHLREEKYKADVEKFLEKSCNTFPNEYFSGQIVREKYDVHFVVENKEIKKLHISNIKGDVNVIR